MIQHPYLITKSSEEQPMVVVDEETHDNAYALTTSLRDEQRIVLHEDKQYYPEADEVYPGVRTVLLDEDTQPLEEPIIKPIKVKNFSVLEKSAPKLTYSVEFMVGLMNNPLLIRNIAVLGHFHHGKTMLLVHLFKLKALAEIDCSLGYARRVYSRARIRSEQGIEVYRYS